MYHLRFKPLKLEISTKLRPKSRKCSQDDPGVLNYVPEV